MFRTLVVAALGLGVAAFAAVRACAWDAEPRSVEEIARSAGTLSSRTRGLVQGGSDEPVLLGMRTHRRYLPNQVVERVDEHIVFRFPAAAFSLIDLADGTAGSNRLGWTFWSRTLDAVRPDTEADRVACEPTNRNCLAHGRVSARRSSGEYVLRIEVTSVISTEENRQRILWSQSGMRDGMQTPVHGPCAYRYDSALDLLATEEPHQASAARACRLSGFVGRGTADGRLYRPANFLKLEPDGTARFVVRCEAYMHDAPDAIGSYCELQGYLGVWPLFVWVLSDRAAEWDETFLRVRDHLARHVVTRSDVP